MNPPERSKRRNVSPLPNGCICALPPERGCVVDQPQQLRKTSLLKYA
jgi:hypothetical protein